MDTYVILRRSAWDSPEELQQAAERSKEVGDGEMADDIRWIRSYVLEEDDGKVGTVCIYQASSADAVREHASRVPMAADEVIKVADTVLIRPDPEPAAAG
jgi:sporulation protein YlmC with PRC-barrel domain